MRQALVWIVVLLAVAGVGAAQEPAAGGPSPQDRLAGQVPAQNFAKVPLATVLEQLGTLSGLTFQADWYGLASAGVSRQTPVTVQTAAMTVQALLDTVLRAASPAPNPLGWYRSGTTIHVSTQQRVLLRNVSPPAAGQTAPAPDRPAPATTAQPAQRPDAPPPSPVRTARAGGGVDFHNLDLESALDFIRDVADVNIHVNWKSLETVGVTRKTPVSVQAHSISVQHLLTLVLDQLNTGRDRLSTIYWLVDDGVVQIATGDAFNRTTATRIFDIGDLLMITPNFTGPRTMVQSSSLQGSGTGGAGGGGGFGGGGGAGLWGGGGAAPAAPAVDLEAQRAKVREDLIATIRESIGEEMWAPAGKGSIRILKDKLILTQTPLGFKLLEEAWGR